MNKKILNISVLTVLGFVTACSNVNTVQTINNTQINNKKVEMGTITLDLSKLMAYRAEAGFTTKGTFRDAYINQLKVTVSGYGMNTVSKIVSWNTVSQPTFSMSVPSGKNRIVSVVGMNRAGQPLAKLMSSANVGQNFTTSVALNYGTSVIGRVLQTILFSSTPDLVERVDVYRLTQAMYGFTGYDEKRATFKYTDPSKADINAIVTRLVTNNGDANPENTNGIDQEIQPVKIRVTVKDESGKTYNTGVTVSAYDISSVEPAVSNNIYTLTVDSGTWELSARAYFNSSGTSIVVPETLEDRKKLILAGGRMLEAKQIINVKANEEQDITLTMKNAEVID